MLAVVLVMLITFLIQFLVVLAALMVGIFLIRPEVPLSEAGSLKAPSNDSITG
jgi:hypothetical protein